MKRIILLTFVFLSSTQGFSQLSGTYTIDGSKSASSTNYKTFTAAVSDLVKGTRNDGGTPNGKGVTASVVFEVASGTYTERLSIRPISGTDTSKTVTFRSASLDSTKVILTEPSSTSSGSNYIIQLDSAHNIIFSRISLLRTGNNPFGRVIEVRGGATFNRFLHLIIRGPVVSSTTSYAALIYSGGDQDTNNIVRNCKITGGSYAAYWYGSSNSYEANNVFDSLQIDSGYAGGLRLYYQYASRCNNNKIYLDRYNKAVGVGFYYSLGQNRINRSRITMPIGFAGIQAENCGGNVKKNMLISNNMIALGGVFSDDIFGIYTVDNTNQNIFYNNINVYGGTSSSAGVYLQKATSGTGHIRFQYNVITNTGGGFAIYLEGRRYIQWSNRNCFYSPGPTPFHVNGNNLATLNQWRQATSLDSFSIFQNPVYKSNFDLHVKNPLLNNVAQFIKSVRVDNDGEIRDTITPDMGADEFSPPQHNLSAFSSINPLVECGSTKMPLGVSLRNFGLNKESNFPIFAELSGAISMNLKDTIRDTLASGSVYPFFFKKTFNTTAGGILNVKIWTGLKGDQDNTDDTLYFSIDIHAIPATPTANSVSRCGKGSVVLTAKATTGDVVLWYDSLGKKLLYAGDTFTTGYLNSSSSYSVTAVKIDTGSLQTTLIGGTNCMGNMFDVKCLNNIGLDSLGVQLDSNLTYFVNIYYRVGGFAGVYGNSNAWKLAGADTVKSSGKGNLTYLHLLNKLVLLKNATYGFYVTLAKGKGMLYTPGNYQFKNKDVQVTTGLGQCALFSTSPTYSTWNGALFYTAVDCQSESVKVKAIINDLAGGSSIIKGSPFKGIFNNGTANNPDGCENGDTMTYELIPPLGHTNSDYGTGWNISRYSFATTSGVLAADTIIQMPTTKSNAIFQLIPNGNFVDSTVILTVSLTENGSTCDSSTNRYIFISTRPRAGFGATDVCTGDSTYFHDSSTIVKGTISWSWDFGDGGFSSLQNPIHKYKSVGSYQVMLVVTSNKGIKDTATAVVKVNALPVASYFVTNTCGNGDAIFNSTSTGKIASYLWYFGDGTTSTDSNPAHHYLKVGTYKTALKVVTSSGCSDSTTKTITVSDNPIADFDYSNDCDGNAIIFKDSSIAPSSAKIIGWNWSFGDGKTTNSQNTSHLYSLPGKYVVTLTLTTDKGCSDSASSIVEVYAMPDPGFSATSGCQGEQIAFDDSSTISSGNITSWYWEFGDGSAGSYSNPTHAYKGYGKMNVKLTVTSDHGCKTMLVKAIDIYPKPIARFGAFEGCLSTGALVADSSVLPGGSISSYLWDFGDGTTSKLKNPGFHKYASAGSYQIKLITVGNNGCPDSTTRKVEVTDNYQASFNTFGKCVNDSVIFLNTSNLHKNTMWYFGDGKTSNLVFVRHLYTNSGTYNVTLIEGTGGCADTSKAQVIVYSNPKITFTKVVKGSSVSFTPSDTTLNSYFWNFGDSKNSNLKTPTHVFSDGKFSVSLSVTDTNKCNASYSDSVYVNSGIENGNLSKSIKVFPNPSNSNDGFLIEYLGDENKKAQLSLIDVEGKLVYQSVELLNLNKEIHIKVDSISPGIYQLKIILDNEVLNVKIFIK